jgi:excisionase family DNA binding protein
MADELLTVNEVAERLKVNQQTVRNWIDRGELAAIRVGARRVRIRREDFEAYLAGERGSASARRTDRLQALESRLDELAARVERLEQKR